MIRGALSIFSKGTTSVIRLRRADGIETRAVGVADQAQTVPLEPYDRHRFQRLVRRLTALVASGDLDGMTSPADHLAERYRDHGLLSMVTRVRNREFRTMPAPGRPRSMHSRTLARDLLAERMNIAAEMRLGGATEDEIGRKLGIDRSGVSRILKAHRQELLARTDENTREWIAQQIGRYEAVARLAARGFERSQKDRQRIEINADGITEKTIIEGQSGNPAYLARLIDAFARIDKLLGTEAPSRTEIDARVEELKHRTELEEALAMDATILPPELMYPLIGQEQQQDNAQNDGNSSTPPPTTPALFEPPEPLTPRWTPLRPRALQTAAKPRPIACGARPTLLKRLTSGATEPTDGV